MTEDELVTLLTTTRIDVPDRDLAPAVLARVSAPSRRAPARRRLVVVVTLATLAIAATAVAAGVVPGIRLTPAGPRPDAAASLDPAVDLGVRVEPEAAAPAAGLPVLRLPTLARLPTPQLWVDRPFLHALYPASTELPELGDSGAGLLLTQFAAPDHDLLVKALPPDAIEEVTVAGAPGWWIEGPHTLTALGRSHPLRPRLTDAVLVWHHDGVTYRLESRLGLDRALAIARSTR